MIGSVIQLTGETCSTGGQGAEREREQTERGTVVLLDQLYTCSCFIYNFNAHCLNNFFINFFRSLKKISVTPLSAFFHGFSLVLPSYPWPVFFHTCFYCCSRQGAAAAGAVTCKHAHVKHRSTLQLCECAGCAGRHARSRRNCLALHVGLDDVHTGTSTRLP